MHFFDEGQPSSSIHETAAYRLSQAHLIRQCVFYTCQPSYFSLSHADKSFLRMRSNGCASRTQREILRLSVGRAIVCFLVDTSDERESIAPCDVNKYHASPLSASRSRVVKRAARKKTIRERANIADDDDVQTLDTYCRCVSLLDCFSFITR